MESRTSKPSSPPGQNGVNGGHAGVDPICKLINHTMHSFNIIDASRIYRTFLETNIRTLKRAMCLPENYDIKNFNVLIYDLPLTKNLLDWIKHLEQIGFNGGLLYIDHHKNESDKEMYDQIQGSSFAIINTRENWPSTLYGIIEKQKRISSELHPSLPTIHFYGSDFDGINCACAVAYNFQEPEDGFFESVHKADSNNRYIISRPIMGDPITEKELKSYLSPTAQLIDEALKGTGNGFKDRQEMMKMIISFYEHSDLDENMITVFKYRQLQYHKKRETTLDCFNSLYFSLVLDEMEGKNDDKIKTLFLKEPVDSSLLGALISAIIPETMVITYSIYPPKMNTEGDLLYTKVLYKGALFKGFSLFFVESIRDMILTKELFGVKETYGLEGRVTLTVYNSEKKQEVLDIIKNIILAYQYQKN